MRFLSSALLTCLLACTGLWAQSAAVSQISGTVRDSSGAAVPGAEVRVTQTDTGALRSVVSGPDGRYILPSLAVGSYRMEVTMQGFSTFVQSGIVLQVNSNPTIDVVLKVGSVAEQVVVESAAAMVETRSSGVGQVVDQQRVVDLPLNGRNATELIFLAGAATAAPAADLNSQKNYPSATVISVAGGAANGMTYLLDGGSYNDPFNNLNLPLPFPDALQEFKVETSALPAQYGQHSAAAVNAVTKSGGNDFHGSAFEFVRNYKFNARNFFATTRDSLKRNQFGGTLGGPIKANKAFFFLAYQQTIERANPTSGFSFIPTPAMMNGDFTTIASAACNNGVAKTLKAPFVNNQISPALFSAPAVKMMTYYPTTSDPCGRLNYGSLIVRDEQSGLARVDYQLSSSNTLFGRHYVSHFLQPSPFTGKNPLSLTTSGADDLVNSFVLGDTHLFGANTINSFRGTFNRSAVSKFQIYNFGNKDLGINATDLTPGLAQIAVTGALSSLSPFGFVARDPTTTYQFADDVSLIRGSHQIEFGANFIRTIHNIMGTVNSNGAFTFNGQTTGLSMADFLMGYVGTFVQNTVAEDYTRHKYFGAYIQDTWRASRRLTVSAGIRWEPYFGPTWLRDWITHFDPDLYKAGVRSTVYKNAPAGLIFPGDPGWEVDGKLVHTNWKNFAPRVGLVWDPQGNGRMTLRASYGLFYDMPHSLFFYWHTGASPWGASVSLVNPPGGFADPYKGQAGGNPFPVVLSSNAIFARNGSYVNTDWNIKNTYLQQWSLSLQKQLGPNWLASVNYMGNNSMHLWGDRQINPAVYNPAPGASTTANTSQRRKLYLQNSTEGQFYAGISQLDDGGTGNYSALLLSLQHRLANHYTVLANYTLSHCISDFVTSELRGGQGSYTNPDNRGLDRGNCPSIDRRHLFNLSTVVEAPKFSERWLQMIAGDWKVGGIVRVQSGAFITLTSGFDQALNGIANQRPNQVLSDWRPTVSAVDVWINPAAFAQPSAGTFGNVGVASLLGPASVQFDMNLVRAFRITEKQRIEIRAEAFNLLNHWRPANPVTALNNSNFGKIQASGDPRIMQFALKYNF